ncbi:MAG: C39 family peptidase [Nanoarchaeota archaeon]|nr:C39 family peptidase [Nanoarchaeota archaeon]
MKRILEVPNIRQRKMHCGPATTAQVLDFLGFLFSQQEIIEAMGLTPLTVLKEGIEDKHIITAAEELGFRAEIFHRLSLDKIVKVIDYGLPIIAPCRSDRIADHYYVIRGYELNPRERVFVNDPGDLRRRRFEYDAFCKIWLHDKYRTGIVISERRRGRPPKIL